jgi:hypothetical protein
MAGSKPSPRRPFRRHFGNPIQIASTSGQTIAPTADTSLLTSPGRLVLLLPSGMRFSLPPMKTGAAISSCFSSCFNSDPKFSATGSCRIRAHPRGEADAESGIPDPVVPPSSIRATSP